jgi:hypothetical protein
MLLISTLCPHTIIVIIDRIDAIPGLLGDLPNMIQPPLLGVVKAASAVSARTPIC